MFEVGEYVVYGNKGVCQIKGVGPLDMPGVSKDRIYYTMNQVYMRGSTIFTPVDSDKLRKVLSKSEATDLIDYIRDVNPVLVNNDKERERLYNETLRNADCRELCKMIIALHRRREQRIADGKKATSTDERYSHAAEDILFGELGIALGINRNEVKQYIIDNI